MRSDDAWLHAEHCALKKPALAVSWVLVWL
jgi:hypothetical protein